MTKEEIYNTNAINTLRNNMPASLDGMGNYKNEFDVQFDTNLDQIPNVVEALRLTLVDIGMNDMDAKSFTEKVIREAQGSDALAPDQSRYDQDYMGRKENPDAYDSYSYTSYNQRQNNPNVHDDSYMGMNVETQMAFAQLTNRVPMGNFTKEMPFEGDTSNESNESSQKQYLRDVILRAKKRLNHHYVRITSNDEQMGRRPNTGYVGASPGSLGWDVTGPSVGGTDGTTNSSSGMSPIFG